MSKPKNPEKDAQLGLFSETSARITTPQLQATLVAATEGIDPDLIPDHYRRVPEIAYDYVGQARADIANKIAIIVDLGHAHIFSSIGRHHPTVAEVTPVIVDASIANVHIHQQLEEIAQYIDDTRYGNYGKETMGQRLTANNYEFFLNNHFQARHQYDPVIRTPEIALLEAVKKHRSGQPISAILAYLTDQRNDIMRRAFPSSPSARYANKQRGLDTTGMVETATKIDQLKDYLLERLK